MKSRILLLFFVSLAAVNTYSQNFLSKIIRGENGITKQFTLVDDKQAISFNSAQLKSLLNLNANSDLVLLRTEQDKLGFIHYRYYQTYKGIPVENSMYIIHTKNGILKSLSGTIVTDFDAHMNERSTQKISDKQAIDIAVKFVNAKIYAWQDEEMEQRIKEQTNNAKASYSPKANLFWYSTTDDIAPNQLRLCYKVDVYARQPLSRAYYYVDAIKGNVLGKKEELFFADSIGVAHTAYSGKQKIHSETYGLMFCLRDYTKGSGIITLHGETTMRGKNYTSSTQNWSLRGENIAALDAHYGVSQTYDFYMSNFNRNSYDNNGAAIYSYVNDETYVDNSFWDGSVLNFCKRSNGDPGGVTGIDIAAHELSHGVTQEASDLNYVNEPGAIDESMSDIMGKSVQFWSKPDDVNWKISNDMGWTIRNMANPNLNLQPDTYQGLYWSNSTDNDVVVHTNSGVGNFMFYLLVTGGTGTNDKGNAYTVSGIGLTKADQIIYRTNTVYLTHTSKYADWRMACINAAADLYGAYSNEVVQVKNAWYAVGVGTQGSPYCVISGATQIEYINKVVLSSIVNTSGNNNGYADFASLSTNLVIGTPTNIKLTPGFASIAYPEYWSVFIDYNQNNSFTDPGEELATGHGKSVIILPITIPSSALVGRTRMRVIMQFDSLRNKPCGDFTNGEAEDYTVNIVHKTLTNAIATTLDKEAPSLIVFPDPVKNSSATVSLSVTNAAKTSIIITDLSGKILYKQEINSLHLGKNLVALNNLNNLNDGVFIITAEQNGVIIGRTKFIINRQ